ncbi:MAG: hypothetical protein ACHQT8_05605 [Chlamydiales bacterium]
MNRLEKNKRDALENDWTSTRVQYGSHAGGFLTLKKIKGPCWVPIFWKVSGPPLGHPLRVDDPAGAAISNQFLERMKHFMNFNPLSNKAYLTNQMGKELWSKMPLIRELIKPYLPST